jgi:hypothetical protein
VYARTVSRGTLGTCGCGKDNVMVGFHSPQWMEACILISLVFYVVLQPFIWSVLFQRLLFFLDLPSFTSLALI